MGQHHLPHQPCCSRPHAVFAAMTCGWTIRPVQIPFTPTDAMMAIVMKS
jgi:hypothetical protein